MIEVITTIDGFHGKVKIEVQNNGEAHQDFTLDWCLLDDKENKTGFLTSFSKEPIFVTEVAAEHFLRMLVTSIVVPLQIEGDGLSIFNHLGEKLDDVEFLPPTVKCDEIELEEFVIRQDNLLQLFSEYEIDEEITESRLADCDVNDVLQDFLSLIQIRASGLQLAIMKPKTNED